MEFNPKLIPYEKLLEIFWKVHNPRQSSGQGVNLGSNYRAALFCHSEAQLEAAHASRDELQKRLGSPIATQIHMAMPFYLAEDYHQQYYEKKGITYCPIGG